MSVEMIPPAEFLRTFSELDFEMPRRASPSLAVRPPTRRRSRGNSSASASFARPTSSTALESALQWLRQEHGEHAEYLVKALITQRQPSALPFEVLKKQCLSFVTRHIGNEMLARRTPCTRLSLTGNDICASLAAALTGDDDIQGPFYKLDIPALLSSIGGKDYRDCSTPSGRPTTSPTTWSPSFVTPSCTRPATRSQPLPTSNYNSRVHVHAPIH